MGWLEFFRTEIGGILADVIRKRRKEEIIDYKFESVKGFPENEEFF